MRDREKERNIRLPESYVQQGGPVRPPRPSRARRAAPRPGPEPPRGKRQRRRPVLRRVLLGVLCLFLAACLSVGGYLYASTRNDFLWLDLEQLPHREATILYAQDRETGEWVEYARLEATQQKIWVPLSEIPEDMQHAFVAIEDKHFYEHHGVSLTRTAYAVLNEMKKALTGTYFGNGIKQGASTIDQQLIKNLTRDDEAGGLEGYMRKVREIWRAYRLDAKYDKETILEAYLNVISFTDNTAGVEAESIKLFGKSARDLSLAQCASIASITKNPYRYDPRTHEEEHLSRRNYILYEMWQQGYITEEQVQCRLGRAHRPFAGQCAGGGNACHDLFHRQGADGCVRRSFGAVWPGQRRDDQSAVQRRPAHLHHGGPGPAGGDGKRAGARIQQLFPHQRAGCGDAGHEIQRGRHHRPG